MKVQLSKLVFLCIVWAGLRAHGFGANIWMSIICLSLIVAANYYLDLLKYKFTINFKQAKYLIRLLQQVIQSTLKVTKQVWQPNPSYSEDLRWLSFPMNSDLQRVVLANSITITPGTITIEIDDNNFLVHALDYKELDDIQDLARQVKGAF